MVRNKLITLQLQIVNNETLLTVQHEKIYKIHTCSAAIGTMASVAAIIALS